VFYPKVLATSQWPKLVSPELELDNWQYTKYKAKQLEPLALFQATTVSCLNRWQTLYCYTIMHSKTVMASSFINFNIIGWRDGYG